MKNFFPIFFPTVLPKRSTLFKKAMEMTEEEALIHDRDQISEDFKKAYQKYVKKMDVLTLEEKAKFLSQYV